MTKEKLVPYARSLWRALPCGVQFLRVQTSQETHDCKKLYLCKIPSQTCKARTAFTAQPVCPPRTGKGYFLPLLPLLLNVGYVAESTADISYVTDIIGKFGPRKLKILGLDTLIKKYTYCVTNFYGKLRIRGTCVAPSGRGVNREGFNFKLVIVKTYST